MSSRLFPKIDLRPYTMFIALIAIWVVMYFMTDGVFVSARNLSNLFVQMSIVGILASGMIMIIISGGIDLSVGSLLGFLGGCAAILQVNYGASTGLTIAITLVLGLIVGSLQGWITAYGEVPSFIVTLGGMMVFRGALLGITNGKTISPVDESLRMLGQSYIANWIGWAAAALIALIFLALGATRFFAALRAKSQRGTHAITKLIKALALGALVLVFVLVMNLYKGVPVPVVVMLTAIVVCTFLTQQTIFGRSIYAIGGNKEAAVYSGIKVKSTILGTFVVEGVLAAVGGLVLTARLNAGTISAGQNLEMDVIAAAVIGGASLSGGVGTVPGTILGALVMASLNNGMSIMNVDAFWQYILKGAVLVIAVYIDVVNSSKKS